ncbi:phospholipase D delta-like [Panicum virgatum]|nr:phospholipase D delta-like [Panicum virgatum]
MSPEMAAKAAEVRALGGVAVEDMSPGNLLKYKSQEGVRMLLLCDDTTSLLNFFLRTRGVMQTHAEQTKKFFRHSSTTPRSGRRRMPRSWVPGSHGTTCTAGWTGRRRTDVLENFEQRWRKTTRLRLKGVLPFGKKAHWKEDALLKLDFVGLMD